MFRSGPGLGLIQMIAIKLHIEYFRLSRAIPFFLSISLSVSKTKLFVDARLSFARETEGFKNRSVDLIFSGIFEVARSQK
jgi:hypothetical protein